MSLVGQRRAKVYDHRAKTIEFFGKKDQKGYFHFRLIQRKKINFYGFHGNEYDMYLRDLPIRFSTTLSENILIISILLEKQEQVDVSDSNLCSFFRAFYVYACGFNVLSTERGQESKQKSEGKNSRIRCFRVLCKILEKGKRVDV